MWFESFLRNRLRKRLTGEDRIALTSDIPPLAERLRDVAEVGLYVHVPFCRQICPYCPYNKERYDPALARRYADAVVRELDFYAGLLDGRPVTSLYIGGGTPTTMLSNGIETIISHIFEAFRVECSIHMESHPNDLTGEALDAIRSMGVEHLSMGVEALQDHHLKALRRPYTVDEVRAAVTRAVERDFQCVNADFIFSLPGQTLAEVEEAGRALVQLGVDQVAAYPLFEFSYTYLGRNSRNRNGSLHHLFSRRRMLRVLEDIFYDAGFDRTSVWAFTRRGVPKYCSVTVPLYIGIGASGSSYLHDVFYLNTFDVRAYVHALENGRLPVALALDLSPRMQMAGWLYWRIYETRFRKSDFRQRFGVEFDRIYGRYMKFFSALGFLKENADEIALSDAGAYWLHVLEDVFSLNSIARLWGTAITEPWPDEVIV
jgi:coproporphyrinogen III oxidase-like Fe-S oxidoreductase